MFDALNDLQSLWGSTETYEKRYLFIPDGEFTAVVRDAGIDTNEETGRSSVFFKLYAPKYNVEETAWMRIVKDENAVKMLKTNLERINLLPNNISDLPAMLDKAKGLTISAYKKSRPKDSGIGYWRTYYFNNRVSSVPTPSESTTSSEVFDDDIPF